MTSYFYFRIFLRWIDRPIFLCLALWTEIIFLEDDNDKIKIKELRGKIKITPISLEPSRAHSFTPILLFFFYSRPIWLIKCNTMCNGTKCPISQLKSDCSLLNQKEQKLNKNKSSHQIRPFIISSFVVLGAVAREVAVIG